MKYIIELVADSKGVQAGVDALEQIGKVDKENAAQFKKTNEEVKKYTSSVDKLSKGLKDTSKAATGAFGGGAIKEAAKQSESFRAQLRASRDELTKLLQSGEATTAQIYDMARAGGELKDSMGDAQQAINVLSSDTFKLDAALQGIQVGAAAFQIIQGAAALAGDENKDLQETLVKLNAVMAITQGLQQIQNALQKQTALSLGLNIAAQKAYTFVVGESAGALKVFRIALASTGIGAVLLAVIALISNWDKLRQSGGLLTKTLEGIGKATGAVVQGFKDLFDALGLSDFAMKESNDRLEQNLMIGLEKMQRSHKMKLDLMRAQNKETLQTELQFAQEELKQLRKLAQWDDSKTEEGKKRLENERELTDKIIILKEQIKQKEIEDAKKLVELRQKQQLERLKQEIELWRAEANELDKHSIERFNIEVNIANNEKKIALLNAKTLSEKLKAEEDFNQKVLGLRKELKVEIEKINSVGLQAEVGSEEWYKKQIAYWEELLSKLRFGSAAYITIRDEIKKLNDELDRLKNPLANLQPKPQGKTTAEEIKERVDKAKIIAQAEIEIAQETADTIFQIVNANRNAEFNLQIQRLNELRTKELANKELTDSQRARVEERYQQKIAAIKTKQAQADKQAAIIQATINGALAITRILATMPGGPLNPATIASLAIAAASTAANIALIASQKIPKFAKGTEYVQGAGTETSDSIPAMLSRGERVIDAKTNKMLKGIPNSMLPELLVPSKTVISKGMDYDKLAKTLSKELAKSPQMRVSFDKEGFNSYIMSRNNTTNIKNNRYDF